MLQELIIIQKFYLKIAHHSEQKNEECRTETEECRTEINETFIDKAEHINIAMPMYNLIEYSENYSNTSGSL